MSCRGRNFCGRGTRRFSTTASRERAPPLGSNITSLPNHAQFGGVRCWERPAASPTIHPPAPRYGTRRSPGAISAIQQAPRRREQGTDQGAAAACAAHCSASSKHRNGLPARPWPCVPLSYCLLHSTADRPTDGPCLVVLFYFSAPPGIDGRIASPACPRTLELGRHRVSQPDNYLPSYSAGADDLSDPFPIACPARVHTPRVQVGYLLRSAHCLHRLSSLAPPP